MFSDDEREALARYEAWHEGYVARIDGKPATAGPAHPNAPSRARRTVQGEPPEADADPDTAFELGRVSGYDEAMREVQGDPTDAQVEAALQALGHARSGVTAPVMRAVLRAAAATQEGENR